MASGRIEPVMVQSKSDVDTSLVRVVGGLPDAVLLIDEEWRITYANTTARRISRISEQDFNGPTLWELYPDIVGGLMEQAYREAMQLRQERAVVAFYYEPFDAWFDLRILPVERGVAVHYSDVTAVRQAEMQRDSIASRLQQVLDVTTDAIIAVDRDWTIRLVNKTACRILMRFGDVVGKNMWEQFPDAKAPGSPYAACYEAAMYEGRAGEFDAYYSAPLDRWFHVMVRPAEDGIVLFVRDISEEREKQQSLRDSEERYRILTELNPQPLWTADAEGRVLYANQRLLGYVGKDFNPKDGTEYLKLFAEEDRARVLEVWSQSVHTGEEYNMDARLIRADDGARRWWHLRAQPVRSESGQILQWLGVAMDVHERRISDANLREQYAETERQKRELEAVYRTSPIGMSLYEPDDLRVLRINERQAETLGVSIDDAVGRRLEELTPDFKEAHVLMRAAAKGEAVLNREIRGELPSRPGEERVFQVSYLPVFAEDGTVRAISGATVEVTQQKKQEAALVQSEKLAAVGRLASSISHEINNPLEAVTNLLYLAGTLEGIPSDARMYVEQAQDELSRVSQIVTQTLRFHRQAVRQTAVTAAQLIDAVLNLYQGRLANSRIKVEVCYSTVRPMICFENDIRQVLNNLIANAIDAMRMGGVLTVRAHEVGKDRVRIAVADTGHGMPRETVERVFEPFYTTKGLNGTGLGLWISHGIVERHGGCLRLRSSTHPRTHGTIFTLELPCGGVGIG